MSFASIVGQDRAISAMRRVLRAGRLAHAYVFTGPPGVGKRATALALARACLCANAPGEGCGECLECHLIEVGSHPDVFVEDLARAQAERASASHVSIDQMRRIRSHLALRPVRGARKLGIVDQAERMTTDAQEALLKTLEEPRGTATLVLVATNADALLPTIRSRCQRVAFAPLDRASIERILGGEGIGHAEAAVLARLAGGSLDRARELASGDGAERHEALLGRLERLGELSVPEVLDLAGELSPSRGEREGRVRGVAALLEVCRRRLHSAVESSRDEDTEDAPARLEAVRRAFRQLERTYATSRDLERNANTHLAWDCLLLELHEGMRATTGGAGSRAGD